MLLMLDNYDSFTYNLVQYLGELGQDVKVYRNDEITLQGVEKLEPSHIVVSPGPCTPNEAGISVPLVKAFAGKIPILGVCLGHQAIGQALGGKIVHAKELMHGKTSAIHHDGKGVFSGLPDAFTATFGRFASAHTFGRSSKTFGPFCSRLRPTWSITSVSPGCSVAMRSR